MNSRDRGNYKNTWYHHKKRNYNRQKNRKKQKKPKFTKRKDGLRPTHQPSTTVYRPYSKRSNPDEKRHKADSTINFTRKALTFLSKHTSLGEPEAVKAFIAQLDSKNGYKRNLCIAYNKYAKYYSINWEMPLYIPEAKLIKIPTKEKLELLISSAGRILSIKLTLSKETGLRPVELCRLKVKDIDLEQRIVYPTTAKRGNARRHHSRSR